MKANIERLFIPTMGTGRWYAILDSHGKETDRFFVDEDSVCNVLDERHANDKDYEGAWDAPEEEYEQVYSELSVGYAENLLNY